jgi:predicted alpha/beta hydrolase
VAAGEAATTGARKGEYLFAAQFEHIRRQWDAVRIPQAAVQVNYDPHSDPAARHRIANAPPAT